MGLLDDRVVIVTGAGRGIGRGEALECARQGAAVVLNEFDPAVGAEVVDEIKGAGGAAVLVEGDVSDVAVADELVATATREFGRLDGLVNNAGVLRDRTLAKMTPEEWDTVIRVHLRGHYAPTHAAVAHWRESGSGGHIVCTASTSGLLGNFGQSNYGAAKAGIAAFAQIVAQETARMGVTCNAIAPAARTRMTEGAYGEIFGATDEFDFWHPDNVAPLVAYLVSDAAAHISGKVFGVQGNAVELYRPWTSVAALENPGGRWDPQELAGQIDVLFAEADMEPAAQNGMARLRYTMTERG
jgi:NAD(P)-dependent dehydrogenase (short-subunit alcohol dehydrogenase family)